MRTFPAFSSISGNATASLPWRWNLRSSRRRDQARFLARVGTKSTLRLESGVIPKSRMKAGREHRVPLSDPAMAILAKLNEIRISGLVFPGLRPNQPLSPSAMELTMRRMKIKGATVHGFRSSFRDWAGNETHFPREVAEAALAHVIGNAAEQAYRRGDALEKRRTADGRLGRLTASRQRRRQGHAAAEESLAAEEKRGDRTASRQAREARSLPRAHHGLREGLRMGFLHDKRSPFDFPPGTPIGQQEREERDQFGLPIRLELPLRDERQFNERMAATKAFARRGRGCDSPSRRPQDGGANVS